MAVGTLSTHSTMFKEQYLVKAIQNQFDNKFPLVRRWKGRRSTRNRTGVQGTTIVIPLRTAAHQAVQSAGENPTLVDAGTATFNRITKGVSFMHSRAGLTNAMKEALKSQVGGFTAPIFNVTYADLTDACSRDLNRQLACGGATGDIGSEGGELAVFESISSQTVTLRTDSMDPQNVEVGMQVTTSGAGGGSANEWIVTAIDRSAGTFTFTGTDGGAADGESIYRWNSPDTTVEGYGLHDAIGGSTGTFWGINRATSTFEYWRAVTLSNGGTLRAINEDLILQAEEQVAMFSDVEGVEVLMCRHPVRRQLIKLGLADKRFSSSSMELGGKVTFMSPQTGKALEIFCDRYMRPNVLYGVCESAYTIYSTTPSIDFMDENGTQWFHVANKPQWEIIAFYYWQLACNKPNANFRIEDITE